MQFSFRWKRNLNRRKQFSINCFRRNEKDTRFVLQQSISSDPGVIRYRYGSKIQRIGEKRNYLGKKSCGTESIRRISMKKKKCSDWNTDSFDFFQWPLIFETVLHDSSSRLREVWLKSINPYKNVIQL